MQWPHAAVAFSFAKPWKMSPPRDLSTAPASRKQDAPNTRAGAFSVSKFKGGNSNGGGRRLVRPNRRAGRLRANPSEPSKALGTRELRLPSRLMTTSTPGCSARQPRSPPGPRIRRNRIPGGFTPQRIRGVGSSRFAQAVFTSTRPVIALALFGACSSSTPFFGVAVAFEASTSAGNETARKISFEHCSW